MSTKSKKHTSLKTKVFRSILLVSLIMILIGSGAGLVLYGYSSLQNYKSEARHLIKYTMKMQDTDYIEKIFKETRAIYEGMPESVRSDPVSDEFIGAVRPLVNDDFYKAREILVNCRTETEQRNMFLMFVDAENSAIVYVVDGDVDEWAFLPGQWLSANVNGIDDISGSLWRLDISHDEEYGWIGTDYEKIYDSKGELLGYAVMDLDLNDFLHRIFGFLSILLPAALLVVMIMASISGRLLNKHLISHLSSMAQAARDYTAKDKVDLDENTASVFEPLGIKTADELEDLWLSMTEMESDVKDTMIRLRSMTAEQERIDAELSIATRIQMGTLPRKYPERDEFVISAYMNPAKEVGGDLYDFFMIDDDHLALVIADVAGKGVSAALFMVIARTLIRNQTEQGVQDPADIFAKVNLKLMDINTTHTFVTAWLGILDIRSGEVTYVDAGHEYPALRCRGEAFKADKDVHCVPLAVTRRTKYESGSFRLESGDTIYLYTDGVTEANVTPSNLYGDKRMLEALNRDPDASPETLINNVREDISEFIKDAPQFDDTTMLCLKYFGTGEEDRKFR